MLLNWEWKTQYLRVEGQFVVQSRFQKALYNCGIGVIPPSRHMAAPSKHDLSPTKIIADAIWYFDHGHAFYVVYGNNRLHSYDGNTQGRICSHLLQWFESACHNSESIPMTCTMYSFQPVLHDWCTKGRGMCYPVCWMVHIKEAILLIGKSSLCGGSGFPFSLSEWSLTICLTPYNRR